MILLIVVKCLVHCSLIFFIWQLVSLRKNGGNSYLHSNLFPFLYPRFGSLRSLGERLWRRLFPTVVFLDGVNSPPSPVDTLLLSKVTLQQYHIKLDTYPASLILSNSRFRILRGWKSSNWRIPHADVGGYADGIWKSFAAHRSELVVVHDLLLVFSFLRGMFIELSAPLYPVLYLFLLHLLLTHP